MMDYINTYVVSFAGILIGTIAYCIWKIEQGADDDDDNSITDTLV